MKDFLQSLKFKILVGILALLLGIMAYAASTDGGRSFISSAIGVIVSPFQEISTTISNKVSSTLDMLANADEYYEENQKLKEKLDALKYYMTKKDLDLNTEMEDSITKLFEKHVPQQTREYIESRLATEDKMVREQSVKKNMKKDIVNQNLD